MEVKQYRYGNKMSGSLEHTCVLILALVSFYGINGCLADPADGFTELPLTNSNFEIQKPYDKRLEDRYSNRNGSMSLWVYKHDKPYKLGSHTMPRTEIRLRGYDYSSGVWQFEGTFYIPNTTSGVAIMQIFGASETASTLQLRIYDGKMMYYKSKLVAADVYDKWFRLNVIHDVGKKKIQIFIDGEQKLVVSDRGSSSHYFKFGVYAQKGDSNYMESRWQQIKIYRK